MYPIEQCSKCGNFIEGSPVYSIIRQGTRAGTKYAVKKVIMFIALPLISLILGPFGPIMGLILAFLIVQYIDKKASKFTDTFDLFANSSTPFGFQCPHCGKTWKRTYEKGVDFTTDSVLKWEKKKIADKTRSDANINLIYAVGAGIMALPIVSFCIISNPSNYFTWWINFIVGMLFIIVSINCGIKSHNKKKEVDYLEGMTASEFRYSEYRNGNPFVGTVRNPDEDDIVLQNKQIDTTQPLQQKVIVTVTEKPAKQIPSNSDDLQNDINLLPDIVEQEESNSEIKTEILTDEVIISSPSPQSEESPSHNILPAHDQNIIESLEDKEESIVEIDKISEEEPVQEDVIPKPDPAQIINDNSSVDRKRVYYLFIPLISITVFVGFLGFFDRNYDYTDWWIDEEVIILSATGIFAALLAIYFIIVRYVLKISLGFFSAVKNFWGHMML